MAVEKTEEVASPMATIRKYCPNEGSRMEYKLSLTEFPDLSGYECPVCGFILPDA